MQLAGMNITYRRYPFETFLDSMAELGIEAIELWGGVPHFYADYASNEDLRALKGEVRARKLNICCFTPEQCVYPFNIAAREQRVRDLSIDYFKTSIYTAVELDVPLVLLTSGLGYYSELEQEAWKRSADSILQIARVAERQGITLVLEPLTVFESNIVTDLGGVLRMLNEVESPALQVVIDTVAMQLAGESVKDYITTLGERVVHYHLVDGDGLSDAHLPPGEGVLPLSQYLSELRDAEYDGHLTLEIMGGEAYRSPQQTLKRAKDWYERVVMANGSFPASTQ